MTGGMTYAPPQIEPPARQARPAPIMKPVVQRAPVGPGILPLKAAFARNFAAMLAGSGAGGSAAVRPSRRALPSALKAKTERASGLPLDDVMVHYDSPEPATIQAHAFARGTDIHLGPGQERHLPHEAWHVVQQKQGRVRPTTTVGGLALNDEVGLEREAEQGALREAPSISDAAARLPSQHVAWPVVQRVTIEDHDGAKIRITTSAQLEKLLVARNEALTAAMSDTKADVMETDALSPAMQIFSTDGLDEKSLREVDRLLARDDTYPTLEALIATPLMNNMLNKSKMIGGFKGAFSTKYKRRDSLSNEFKFDHHAMLQKLRDKNTLYQKLNTANVATDKKNYLRIGITANFRTEKEGAFGLVSLPEELNRQWTSGAQQPILDAEGKQTGLADRADEMSAFVRHDRFLPENRGGVFTKLTSANDNSKQEQDFHKAIDEWEKKSGEKVEVRSQRKVREQTGIKKGAIAPASSGSDIEISDEFHMHSEVAAASDAMLYTDFQTKFAQFAAEAPENAKLLSLVLHIDSFPNTMCMNLCRTAIEIINQKFSSAAHAYDFKTEKSATFGTILQVSAMVAFQPKTNPRLSLMPANDNTTPMTQGANSSFEIKARLEGSEREKAFVESKKRKRAAKGSAAKAEQTETEGIADASVGTTAPKKTKEKKRKTVK